MPLSYGPGQDQPRQGPPSLSPESHPLRIPQTPTRVSREEVIERLKRGELPPWTLKSPPNLLPSPEILENPEHIPRNEASSRSLHSGDFWQERDMIFDERMPYPDSPTNSWRAAAFRRPSLLSSSPNSGTLLLPPTTPLIHSLSNSDLDSVPTPEIRRFSAFSIQSPRYINGSPTPDRYSTSHPYQAHQPQRSVSIPHTPRNRPRGLSSSSQDHSHLQHAPMVGSYEESILLGRMSTTPSKPLTFIAQVGVLGKGKCKPNLRCPPHASVSFPAVFYSYASNMSKGGNEPSPYVGLIDVEHEFPSKHDSRAPPGGYYRIPQIGQIQVIIKNPNKTAVKLFLVPYDLKDMSPGTKTFVRQRSYVEESAEAGTSNECKSQKQVLRYLIHLNICCTARGRLYLHKSIRVVFANRVPDGKEKLRNEVSWPEPKYSVYKTQRESSTAGLGVFNM